MDSRARAPGRFVVVLWAVAGALVGGLLAATCWALMNIMSETEHKALVVAFGVTTGLGVLLAVRSNRSVVAGFIAVVVTAGAIIGGKATTIRQQMADVSRMHEESAPFTLRQGFVARALAERIIEEFTANGQVLEWPDGVTHANVYLYDHYPEQVRAEVQRRLEVMSPQERRQYADRLLQDAALARQAWIDRANHNSLNAMIARSAGTFDVVYALAACLIAYGLVRVRA